MVTAQMYRTNPTSIMPPGQDASETLEQKAQSSWKEAFCNMVEEYWGMAYGVALRILKNPQDAEDAVQDAFISAYRAFTSFRGQSKLSTWLYRILVNTCLMRIRKERTRAKHLPETIYEDALAVYDWADDPEESAINGELRGLIEDALHRIPPDLRVVVALRDVQGLSNQEAAEELDIGISALKSRLHRGRVLLREHLQETLGPDFASPDQGGVPM